MIKKTDFIDKALQHEIDLLLEPNGAIKEDRIVRLSDSYHFILRYSPSNCEMMVFFHESGPEKIPRSGGIAANYCGGFNIYKDSIIYYSTSHGNTKRAMPEELADNHPELFEWCLWNLI